MFEKLVKDLIFATFSKDLLGVFIL